MSASTVGYGDIVPTTGASRLFAAIMVFIGFGFFSMVVASISAYFVGEEEKVEAARGRFKAWGIRHEEAPA